VAFKSTSGIVYVLPETRTARAVFSSYDVDELAPAAGSAVKGEIKKSP
jgi:hypothetical protein